MSIYILAITCGIIAYLIGSNNWAYLIAKINGVDIVKTGTGNPGAANVYREISPIAGISVFIADLFTGSLVFLTRLSWIEEGSQALLLITASVMIMIGTAYPLFRFKTGGTGLAKCIGIIFDIRYNSTTISTKNKKHWSIWSTSYIYFMYINFYIFRYCWRNSYYNSCNSFSCQNKNTIQYII